MTQNDFFGHDWPITQDGTNTILLRAGATLRIEPTGKLNAGVDRLRIVAAGFEEHAEAAWNAVEDAIYREVGIDSNGDPIGIIVGVLDEYRHNNGHMFMIEKKDTGIKVTVNWNFEGGGIGGGPPEDTT